VPWALHANGAFALTGDEGGENGCGRARGANSRRSPTGATKPQLHARFRDPRPAARVQEA